MLQSPRPEVQRSGQGFAKRAGRQALTEPPSCRLNVGELPRAALLAVSSHWRVRRALPRSADAVDAARRPNGLSTTLAPSG